MKTDEKNNTGKDGTDEKKDKEDVDKMKLMERRMTKKQN